MATRLGEAFIALTTKDELDRGLHSARGKVDGWLKSVTQGIAQGIGQAIAQGIGNAVKATLDQFGKVTVAADSLNEAIIRNQKVFGDSADEIRAWAQTADKALGLSEQAALSNASALGNMLTQLGVSREQAALMSKQMVKTAADLAEFHQVTGGAAAVLETFASGFRGEYDSLQRYLPAITDAAIKHKALADTGKQTEDQLTSLDKALATQKLILEGATSAAGSFADAIARGAAAEEIFAARMENARADLGQVGLIIQQEFFSTLNELLDSMGFYGQNIVEQLVVGLTQGLIAITPFLAQLKAVFVEVLRPGSPPKLLPELTDWGKAAMQEYLRGWTLADFDALRDVGGIMESVIRSFASTGEIAETDLVSRVFGSQRAIGQAIRDFNELGSVTVRHLEVIRKAAGPAGDSVVALVEGYFDLQNATKRAADAQYELTEVTRRYDAILSPLQGKLGAIQDRQQELRDQRRLAELRLTLSDITTSAYDKEQAALEIQQIQLQDEIDAREDERDIALDGAEKKLSAAEQEQKAAQEKYNFAQSLLDQQVKTNSLIAEETALRQRLIEEGLVEERRVLAELEAEKRKAEAEERKRLAELERIADAQLRYRLELADTAGDLEIMRAELAKTTEGTAEYFDILTQIHRIEEQLAKEREDGGGAGTVIVEAGKAALENKKYLEDFKGALDAATGALFGTDGKEVKLTPFWAGVAETIKDIGQTVTDITPIIMGFIGLFTGESSEVPLADILRPVGGGGGGFFSSIIPGLRGLISNLTLLKDGDWAALWNNFKVYVNELLNGIDPAADPSTFALYSWIQKELIPAAEDLARGEWAKTWQLFADLAMAPFVALDKFLKERGFGGEGPVGIAPDPNAEFSKPPGSDGDNIFEGLLDNFNAYLEAYRARLRELFPDASDLPFPSHEGPGEGIWDYAPQSFVTPQEPLAGVAGMGTSTTNSTTNGPISISINVQGGGAGVGEQARNGVMDALRRAGLA